MAPSVNTERFLSPSRPVAGSKLKNDYRFAAAADVALLVSSAVTHCHPGTRHGNYTHTDNRPARNTTTQYTLVTSTTPSDSLSGPAVTFEVFLKTQRIFLLMIFGFHQTHTSIGNMGTDKQNMGQNARESARLTSDKLIIQSFNQPAGGASQPSPAQPSPGQPSPASPGGAEQPIIL